jgi:hypothetical protein
MFQPLPISQAAPRGRTKQRGGWQTSGAFASRSRWLLSGAIVAALGAGTMTATIARAADTQPAVTDTESPGSDISPGGLTLRENFGQANTASRTPLMSLFDTIGVGSELDNLGIRIYGHGEFSLTHNFDNPRTVDGVANFGRVFDVYNNRGQLNQVTVNFERLVDPTKKQWDVGGRVELMYGTDADFIHADGLGDSRSFFTGPGNQFDLTQAYVDVAVPVGDGLRIRAGKFVYFKQLDPNASVFYSHSFAFGSALPFTLTGIYGTYQFGGNLSADAGISRGFDQSLRDNNGAIDAFGRVKYSFNDRTSVTAAVISGPEQDHDNSHYRTVFDATLTHRLTDTLTLLADGIYGYEAKPDEGTTTNTTAQWYGVSGYAIQKLTDQVSIAGRLEWYADQGGYTTGLSQNLYEATVGATITPFPHDNLGQNLKFRPELRWDYSDRRYFDDAGKHDQFTFAVDAIYNF